MSAMPLSIRSTKVFTRSNATPVALTSSTPAPTSPVALEISSLISLRRVRRALRQRAHFRGDDGEAAAGFAGARRLDAGVERQQVGLERDLVDHADDRADLV